MSWQWDPTLYEGSAAYYARGRMPYPPALVDALRDALDLDGTGRLLDVGCGPAALTALLAPHVAEAVGIDADPEMIAEARRRSPANATFVQMRAEELPGDLGTFDVVTFAQSFHWLEQERVALVVHHMLRPGGAFASVGATTHRGEGEVPHDAIVELVRSYLGPVRRAGQGSIEGDLPWRQPEALAAAGFDGPLEIEVPVDVVHERSEDDLVAAVFSQSLAAPHLFGDRIGAFEADLRALLRDHAPPEGYRERLGDMTLRVWRRD